MINLFTILQYFVCKVFVDSITVYKLFCVFPSRILQIKFILAGNFLGKKYINNIYFKNIMLYMLGKEDSKIT